LNVHLGARLIPSQFMVTVKFARHVTLTVGWQKAAVLHNEEGRMDFLPIA
jgi:hypothetical protein